MIFLVFYNDFYPNILVIFELFIQYFCNKKTEGPSFWKSPLFFIGPAGCQMRKHLLIHLLIIAQIIGKITTATWIHR